MVIQGSDFENINGYPCLWGWGMEDFCLQKRAEKYGLIIDRSEFYPIGSPEILQLFDGISRIISKKDTSRIQNDNGLDGVKNIHQLLYSIDSISENSNDNVFSVENPKIFYINIKTFSTYMRFDKEEYYHYDLREPRQKLLNPDKWKETQNTVTTTEDWTNIPYYPTMKERRENTAKKLLSQGMPIPKPLMDQIQKDRLKDVEADRYNYKSDNTNTKQVSFAPEIQESNQFIRKNTSNIQQHPSSAHLFSKEYAKYQPKSNAKPSARIGLGGVY